MGGEGGVTRAGGTMWTPHNTPGGPGARSKGSRMGKIKGTGWGGFLKHRPDHGGSPLHTLRTVHTLFSANVPRIHSWYPPHHQRRDPLTPHCAQSLCYSAPTIFLCLTTLFCLFETRCPHGENRKAVLTSRQWPSPDASPVLLLVSPRRISAAEGHCNSEK